MIGTNHTFQRVLDKAQRMYTLPPVALRVLELTADPTVDTYALKACIENDPALTAKVLRVVNSSLFGLACEVRDLNQALALLGANPLKLLVLGFSLPQKLLTGVAGRVLRRYWRQSLTKAVAARQIAQALFGVPADEAFVGGLLDDLGMLVLVQEIGEPYIKLLDRRADDLEALADAELRLFGFDHRQLSLRLLEHWGLPPSLIVAMQAARHPESLTDYPEADRPLAQVLHLAGLLSSLLADERLAALTDLLETGERYCRLTPPVLDNLVAAVKVKVGQLAELLTLRLPIDITDGDILARAYEQLSLVAAEAAGAVARSAGAQAAPFAFQSLQAECEPPADDAAADDAADAEPCESAHLEGGLALAVETDRGLLARLTAAVSHCRQTRLPLSLILAELDRLDELTLAHGREVVQAFIQELRFNCENSDFSRAATHLLAAGRVAIVLSSYDRRAAAGYGREFLRRARELATVAPIAQATLSIGAATLTSVPKNFTPRALLESAGRCLFAAQSSGGNALKSIEL